MFVTFIVVFSIIVGGAAGLSLYYWLKHENGVKKIKGFFGKGDL